MLSTKLEWKRLLGDLVSDGRKNMKIDHEEIGYAG
jgi:hypothetical protein